MSDKSSSSSRQRRRKAKRRRARPSWLAIGAILALLSLIVYFTWEQTASVGGLNPEDVSDPALGALDAPIVITEYADFGCPACRAWHTQGIREQVLSAFDGQVRFVWKDFPVITPRSPQAAEAGQCAAVQGKFWEFHDTVYEGYAGLEEGALRDYATRVGLDMDAFDQCLAEGQMHRKVQANEQEARRLGLRGTPGFAINGQPLPAPPSFEQLASLIQQALAAQ